MTLDAHPDNQVHVLSLHLKFMSLFSVNQLGTDEYTVCLLTQLSTPTVGCASFSGNHCWSVKRSNKLLFPTDAAPRINSFTWCVSTGWRTVPLRDSMEKRIERECGYVECRKKCLNGHGEED